jgi:hypothetical protein
MVQQFIDFNFLFCQLIFLPPTSRAAVGILICVVCCCTLNYYQPHCNTLVLFVSQMSFLMSTFKYVCAVFLRINDLNVEDRKVMGWILVALDVVFMLASVVAFVLVIVLLRAVGIESMHGNNEVLGLLSVKVVPSPQQEEQQHQHQESGGGDAEEQQREQEPEPEPEYVAATASFLDGLRLQAPRPRGLGSMSSSTFEVEKTENPIGNKGQAEPSAPRASQMRGLPEPPG